MSMGNGNGNNNAAQMRDDELIRTPEPTRRRRCGEGFPIPSNPQAVHAWQYVRVDMNNNAADTHYGELPAPVTLKAPGRRLANSEDEVLVTPPPRHTHRRWMRSPLSDDQTTATSTTPSLGGSGEKQILRATTYEGLTVEMQNSLSMIPVVANDDVTMYTETFQSISNKRNHENAFGTAPAPHAQSSGSRGHIGQDIGSQPSSSSSAKIPKKSENMKPTSSIDLHAFFRTAPKKRV